MIKHVLKIILVVIFMNEDGNSLTDGIRLKKVHSCVGRTNISN